MKCNEIKALLSAYADGELSDELKNIVDQHIAECAECKELLAEQVKLHEQIGVISKTPALPDMQSRIMAAVTDKGAQKKTRPWLRPVLVAAPVVLALAILLPIIIPPAALTPEAVMAKASEAIQNVKSYRFVENTYTMDPTTDEFTVQDYHAEAEVTSNGYQIQWGIGTAAQPLNETIVLDTMAYTLNGGSSHYLTPEEIQQFTPSATLTQGKLDMLEKIEVLPDETIDGTVCFHYRGTDDLEKFMEDQKPAMEKSWVRNSKDHSEEGFNKYFNGLLQDWKNLKITDEFWIGKDDYIIRQWKEVLTMPADDPASGDFNTGPDIRKYFDFNAPIEIKAPLDAQGNLLPRWTVFDPNAK
jgi:hypothetical protein